MSLVKQTGIFGKRQGIRGFATQTIGLETPRTTINPTLKDMIKQRLVTVLFDEVRIIPGQVEEDVAEFLLEVGEEEDQESILYYLELVNDLHSSEVQLPMNKRTPVRKVRADKKIKYLAKVVLELKIDFASNIPENNENKEALRVKAAKIMSDHGVRRTTVSKLAREAAALFFIPDDTDIRCEDIAQSRVKASRVAELNKSRVDNWWQRYFGFGTRSPVGSSAQ